MAILQGARITGSIIATTFIKANGFSGSITASNLYVLGKAGIGTTSPTVPLDVQCDTGGTGIKLRGRSDNSTALRFYANNATTQQAYIGTDDSNIDFNSVSTRPIRFSVNSLIQYQINQLGVFSWYDGAGGTRMTLNSTGLGIGTTSPTELLTIKGTDPAIKIDNGTKNYLTQVITSDNRFRIYDNILGVERFTILTGGNVGIGTTSPSYKLDVSGSSRFTGTITGGNNIELIKADGPYVLVGEGAGVNQYGVMDWDATNNILRLATQPYAFGANGGQINLTTSGNVGIGTTSPAVKLHVDGFFISKTLWSDTSANSYWGNYSTAYGRLTWDTGLAWINATAGNVLYLGADGANKHITIATSGNVGIGTTSPLNKLSVISSNTFSYYNKTDPIATFQGVSPATVLISVDGNTDGYYAELKLGNAHSTYYSYSAYIRGIQGAGIDYYRMEFGTANGSVAATRMTIATNGNVGIGTTSPGALLHVNNGEIWAFGATNERILLGDSTSPGQWGGFRWNTSVDNLQIVHSGYLDGATGAIEIVSSGNVGIGTTAPAYKLDVSGSISADAFLGKSFGMTGTSGSTAIYDAYLSNGQGEVYELIAAGSPNAAGSSGYKDVLYGKIIIGTGYNGSRVTTYINYVQENPDPRSLYNSGLGTSLSASICFKSGSSEVTNKPAGQSTKIRVKIGSYISNAYAGYTTVRVKRLF